jgi:nucleotide-binding universal stress UspA family protein
VNSPPKILIVLPDAGLEPRELLDTISLTTNQVSVTAHLLTHLRLSELWGQSPHSVQTELAEAREAAQERAVELMTSLVANGHAVQFHTTTGDLAVQAARLAEELGSNFILAGETHSTFLERLLRIGIVDTLTQLAHCPIVLLPSARGQKRAPRPFPFEILGIDWRLTTPKIDRWLLEHGGS